MLPHTFIHLPNIGGGDRTPTLGVRRAYVGRLSERGHSSGQGEFDEGGAQRASLRERGAAGRPGRRVLRAERPAPRVLANVRRLQGRPRRSWTSRRPGCRRRPARSRWWAYWTRTAITPSRAARTSPTCGRRWRSTTSSSPTNGASFDLPFIEHHFGSVFKHKIHIDLRFRAG